MKLARVGQPGLEKPAIIHTDGTIRDLSDVVADISGQTLTPAGLKSLGSIDGVMRLGIEGLGEQRQAVAATL